MIVAITHLITFVFPWVFHIIMKMFCILLMVMKI